MDGMYPVFLVVAQFFEKNLLLGDARDIMTVLCPFFFDYFPEELLMDKKRIRQVIPYLLSAGMAFFCAFVLGIFLIFAGCCPDLSKLSPITLLSNSGFQILCLMLLPVFYWVFSRFFLKKRPFRAGALVLAALFSVFFIVGFCQDVSQSTYFSVPIFGILGTALQFAAALIFFYAAIVLVDEKTETLSTDTGIACEYRSRKSMLLSGITCLLVLWIPYLIAFFPGSLCYDAQRQLMQVFGIKPLSNHNPIFDTVLYGILYNAGSFVGRTDNAGMFAITLFQWLLLGFSLGYCVQTVYDITRRPVVRYILLGFFGLNPLFGGAVQVMLKDTVHLAFFVLYYSMLLRMILLPQEKGQLIKTAVLCLLALLTRKASLPYVFLAGLMTAWQLRKTTGKKLLIATVAVAVCFFAFENLLLPLLNVEEAPSRELYSLFVQNVAYIVRNHQQELTAFELETVDRLIGLEKILTDYNPNLADPLKNGFAGPGEELLRLNWALACKYPMDALRGVLTVCWQYYYPFTNGSAYIYAYMAEVNVLGKDIHYVFPTLQKLATWYAHAWANVPVLSLLIGPGLYSCALMFTAMRIGRKKQRHLLPLVLPLIILTVGLIVTPVNGENRYAFPVIAMAPVFFFLNGCSREEAD